MKTGISKNALWLVGLIMAFSLGAQAQESMINYRKDATLTQQQQHYLNGIRKSLVVKEYWLAEINHEVLKSSTFSVSNPFMETFVTQTAQLKSHGRDFFSWYGFVGEQDWQTSITINKGMVHATINLGTFQFVIQPLGEGLHVVYKTESTPDLDCGSHDSNVPGKDKPVIPQPTEPTPVGKGYQTSPKPAEENSRGGVNCNVRLLVAYTTSVDDNTADIKGFIQNLVNYWNGAQVNSNVSHSVELARSIEVTYTETNTTTNDPTYGVKSRDLLRFFKTTDGWMDNIHDQRNLYDADMCILLVDSLVGNSGAIGGQAMEIQADAFEAFCAMWYRNVTPTFPHEFGHLYGCRHDTYVDATNTPYAYGHGYVWLGAGTNFRTIMAYRDECDDGGVACNRIPNWSNPGITFGGNATGTVSTEDNARVNDVRASVVADFQLTNTFKSFFDSDNITIDECADMYAHSSITTDPLETIYFFSGSEGTFRAGDHIVLSEGFRAYSGSTFEARLESCNDLFTGGNGEHREGDEGAEIVELDNGIKIQSFPNPFRESNQLRLAISETYMVRITVLNMIGEVVQVVTNSQLSKGVHSFTIDGSRIAGGVYNVSIEVGEQHFFKRIIKAE